MCAFEWFTRKLCLSIWFSHHQVFFIYFGISLSMLYSRRFYNTFCGCNLFLHSLVLCWIGVGVSVLFLFSLLVHWHVISLALTRVRLWFDYVSTTICVSYMHDFLFVKKMNKRSIVALIQCDHAMEILQNLSISVAGKR